MSGHKLKVVFAAVLLAFWSSCAVEQEFSGTSHILTTFRLTTPAAMDGKLTISEAYLKLDRIEVSGSHSGKINTSLTHSIPAEEPPYRLTQADSGAVNFAVSSRMFDQLDLHLFPFTDSYQLVYLDAAEETPAPVEEPQQGENEDTDEDEEQGANGDADDSNNESDGDNNNGSGDDNDGHDDDGDNKDNDSDDDDDGDKSEDDDGDKSGDDKEDHKKDKDDDKDKDDKKDEDKDGDKHDHEGNDHDHDEEDKSDDDDDRDKDKDENKDDDDDDDEDEKDDDDDDDRDDRKSRNDANGVVDLDHFFQNARPGMVVFGVYENNGKTINLILVVTDVEKLSVTARQSDSFAIVLEENNTAKLSFDPAHWFESITPADVEAGTMQMYQNQNVLFIHPDHNAALYQALVPRIEGSADLQIKGPGSENL